MGSVIDYIECPHCGHEAYSDFYYKTGEEYVNCGNCGYHHSVTIINRDKQLNELTDDDWKIKELKNPYGAYRIKHYDSVGYECGSLSSKKQFESLKQQVEKSDTVELFAISRFVDGQIVNEIIIDNGPKYDGAGFSVEDIEYDSNELPF